MCVCVRVSVCVCVHYCVCACVFLKWVSQGELCFLLLMNLLAHLEFWGVSRRCIRDEDGVCVCVCVYMCVCVTGCLDNCVIFESVRQHLQLLVIGGRG